MGLTLKHMTQSDGLDHQEAMADYQYAPYSLSHGLLKS